jgi:hypothetical protein
MTKLVLNQIPLIKNLADTDKVVHALVIRISWFDREPQLIFIV